MDFPPFEVIDGYVVAFCHDLPPGTLYFTCTEWANDPGASPHERGVGADDRHRRNVPVIVVAWPGSFLAGEQP